MAHDHVGNVVRAPRVGEEAVLNNGSFCFAIAFASKQMERETPKTDDIE